MPIQFAVVSAMRTPEQTRSLDAEVGTLAGRQHGVVSRAELLAIGLRPGAIGRRLRAGRLHRLHPGVYAVGHPTISREGRWMAAVRACGPGSVLSHRSAAELWGIRQPSGGRDEVTTSRRSRSAPRIHRHFAELPGDEVTTIRSIPVTTISRTLFDLAAVLSLSSLEHAMREAERLHLHDDLSLEDLLLRHPSRRGAASIIECLRRLRELPSGTTRGALEARFVVLADRAGLPRPRPNAWLLLGRHRFQVDFLWERPKLIVELDGYSSHGTRAVFESDRSRDRALAVAGYQVIRLTWYQLQESPSEIVADLRMLLGSKNPVSE